MAPSRRRQLQALVRPQTTTRTLGNQSLLPLGLADRLIGKEDEVARDGLVSDEAHGFLVAGLGDEALVHHQYDRRHHQSLLVVELVGEQCEHALAAAAEDEVARE